MHHRYTPDWRENFLRKLRLKHERDSHLSFYVTSSLGIEANEKIVKAGLLVWRYIPLGSRGWDMSESRRAQNAACVSAERNCTCG